jgi:uncharacterized protein (TIGR02246 family)
MENDEQAIRELVDKWLTASQNDDMATLLRLMSDDVVFMVPGKEPFGKEGFKAGAQAMKNARMEAKSDIQEIKVLGDWAWMRNHLKVTITPTDGSPMVRSGYVLTILHRTPSGWVIARDANLLTPESDT